MEELGIGQSILFQHLNDLLNVRRIKGVTPTQYGWKQKLASGLSFIAKAKNERKRKRPHSFLNMAFINAGNDRSLS
jgi:hypothetical protein